MQFSTEPVTLNVGRAYKADVVFKTLPLDSYDIILGSPWLGDNLVKLDFADKTATFAHQGKTVVIQPENPVKILSSPELTLPTQCLPVIMEMDGFGATESAITIRPPSARFIPKILTSNGES